MLPSLFSTIKAVPSRGGMLSGEEVFLSERKRSTDFLTHALAPVCRGIASMMRVSKSSVSSALFTVHRAVNFAPMRRMFP